MLRVVCEMDNAGWGMCNMVWVELGILGEGLCVSLCNIG